MRHVLRTPTGDLFEIVTPGCGLTELQPISEHDGVAQLVPLRTEQLRTLFDGTTLERALRIAKLPAGIRSILFGRSYDAKRGLAPHYKTAHRLHRIGRVLCDPAVLDALRTMPVKYLLAAVRYPHDPERQIRAAFEARMADRLRERA